MKSPLIKTKNGQIDKVDSVKNQSNINDNSQSKKDEYITEFNPNMQYMDTQEIEENF